MPLTHTNVSQVTTKLDAIEKSQIELTIELRSYIASNKVLVETIAATLQTTLSELKANDKGISYILNGNGVPGLVAKVDENTKDVSKLQTDIRFWVGNIWGLWICIVGSLLTATITIVLHHWK